VYWRNTNTAAVAALPDFHGPEDEFRRRDAPMPHAIPPKVLLEISKNWSSFIFDARLSMN
jgi:hypothetical protein